MRWRGATPRLAQVFPNGGRMARLIQKGVLGVSLAGGVAILLAGHQLYMIQSVVRGDSRHEPLIVPALVPRFESMLGKETMLAPRTVNVSWVAGGILAGVGFLGLLVIGLQESSQARKAARLVPPPKFDERDKVSSHDFMPEGLEGRARMIRFFAFVAFLPVLFAPILIRSAVIRGQPVIALVVSGVAVGFAALGVFVWRGDKNRFRKYGVERIDVMIGGLRWVRHDDSTERTGAWWQIAGWESACR